MKSILFTMNLQGKYFKDLIKTVGIDPNRGLFPRRYPVHEHNHKVVGSGTVVGPET